MSMRTELMWKVTTEIILFKYRVTCPVTKCFQDVWFGFIVPYDFVRISPSPINYIT